MATGIQLGLWKAGDKPKIWQRYCGFLGLSLPEFMEIQERLLMEQLDLAAQLTPGKKLLGRAVPSSIEEFRRLPLTTYDDYSPYLQQGTKGVTAEEPCCWARTSGRTGVVKWVPYTPRAYEVLARSTIAAFILACARNNGDVNLEERERVLLNLPPRPYFTGHMAAAASTELSYRAIPSLDKAEAIEFQQRIEEGFRTSLRTGLDFVASLSSVMARVGERFEEQSGQTRLSRYMWHPAIALRLFRALLRSKFAHRPTLPKDIWSPKGIVCGGTDTFMYREAIKHYWGIDPLDIYASTEVGIIATQTWTRQGMCFIPYACFLEFIPLERGGVAGDKKASSPLLLSQVELGKDYEMVVTSFYGMPFLRYRLGDIVRIVSRSDGKAGVNLPHMEFRSRTQDIIDLAGFARLDEKTIWQAIDRSGVAYRDWTCHKEYEGNRPILRLYLEAKDRFKEAEVEEAINKALGELDTNFRDMTQMLGFRPLKVRSLASGTFERYYQKKRAQGHDLAHLKPPHICYSEEVIQDILRLDRKESP